MAVISFNVSDELARKIRGLVQSGLASEITFCVVARQVERVRAEYVWLNETVTLPRRFEPGELDKAPAWNVTSGT